MPNPTFFNLPQEKKQKIIEAAKKEFSRANIKDASIKNIVEDAEIARGSFYQYFESKEDLLYYLLKEYSEKLNKVVEKKIEETNGDIFEIFISIYDYLTEECIARQEKGFFKKIIEEIKTSQDEILAVDFKKCKPKNIENYYNLIDKSKLKMDGIEDFRLIIRMLYAVTKKAIVIFFKYKSKEKAKEDYLKQLQYIKYGVMRKGGENV